MSYRFIYGPKDLIHLSDLSFVLQIYWGIEVRYLLVGELRDGVSFTSVEETRNLYTKIHVDRHSISE